jgi:hypothetical protein
MPIAGGLILAGVLIGIVIVLTKRADGSTGVPAALPGGGVEYDMPPLDVGPGAPAEEAAEIALPPDTPEKITPDQIPPEVKIALKAIEQCKANGTPVAPEILASAVEACKEVGLTKTCEKIAAELDKTMTEKIPALIAQPDNPGVTIPVDKKTGKKLWIVDVRGSMKMAIPNFPTTLLTFKALQKAIGGKLKADGRIGDGTLRAFHAKLNMLGFERYPQTVEVLAANAVKWTEVLKKHFQPGQVGRPFDIPSRQWREFVARVNSDWDKLAPVVKEKLGSHIGQAIEGQTITLSGLCGIVNRAGMRGAEKWLGSESDRVKYPATTRAFHSTNGIF